MSQSPIARIVLNIMHRVYGGYKNKPQEAVVMEEVENPPKVVDRKSIDAVQEILAGFKGMPDFVPNSKKVFGINDVVYPVVREEEEHKKHEA